MTSPPPEPSPLKGEGTEVKILFVCYGNTCRSPMAEALFNKMAKDKGISARASSAGIMAITGGTAAPYSIAVMAQSGIDLTRHRSRLLDNEILEEADLILAMDNSNLQAVPEGYKDMTFLLSDYASDTGEDVFDPIGGDLETYKACASLIRLHVTKLIDKIED